MKTIAQAREDKLRAQMERPLTEHVQEYLARPEAASLDARHRRIVEAQLRRFLNYAWDVDTLMGLEAHHLEGLLVELAGDGRSASTQNHYRNGVRAFINWCVQTGRLDRSPFAGVRKRPEETDRRYVRRPLTPEEFCGLLAVAGKLDPTGCRRAFYALLGYAGLRRSECERLRWPSVDLPRRLLTIDRGKAKRLDVVPMREELAQILLPVLAWANGWGVGPCGRVLPSVPQPKTVKRDFERAGIPTTDKQGRHADAHSFRVSLGTGLARSGASIPQTRGIMRHADYRTTEKHYQHQQTEELRRALEQVDLGPGMEDMEALLSGGNGPAAAGADS